MTEMKKTMLQVMLKKIDEEYQSCRQDRHKLHKLEWEGEESEPSILGEVEVIADTVIGLVKTYLEIGAKNKGETVTMLQNYSIYKSPVLLRWLLGEGRNFNHFALYMTNVEHLRMTFSEMIKSEKKAATEGVSLIEGFAKSPAAAELNRSGKSRVSLPFFPE
ncbi:hypothetical protein QUF80_03095 [Desulfococcaceae bacterium HSG8]|nr:hypothetical protein [Desulfococcaceae bacterium HSG8]